jgi:CYTH domain-containing protein
MIGRTPGQGRYAQMEREQRWILRELPGDLDHPVSIVDLYISDTRLRLRRMENNSVVVYKLGQKVRVAEGEPEMVKLTNLYLSEREYTTLAQLGGAEIRKTRWRWSQPERPVVVDEFGGRLAGLVLAELELGPDDPRMKSPPLAAADVTDEDRFSGGRLALTSAAELVSLLAAFVPSS